MIRPSLAALAIAGASLFSCASTSAQGHAQPSQSNELATTTAPQDPAQQDPALRAHKEQLEQELQALKKQQKDLNALVEKLKARANAAADEGAAAEKAAVAEAKQRRDSERAEQERREQEVKTRIERIEKRVATEIARVKENAKKEIEKAKAEAREPQDKRGFKQLEIALSDSTDADAKGQTTKPPAQKRAAKAPPMLAQRIDGPIEGQQPARNDREDEPLVVMLDDVSEAHRTNKATPGQEPAARSPMFVSTQKVEGKPVERVIVMGEPAPQVWRKTEIETNEDDMHWFVSGDDGLPHHRVDMRERRIETNDDADGACCDCECPMCGEGKKAQAPRAGREVERIREIRSRNTPRGEQFPGRIAPRREEARRIVEMRIEGDDEDMEIERLLGELRRRLQARRDENRRPRMFEVRNMPGNDAAPQFVIEAEDMPAPKKPATEVRRTRAKKAPADAGDEAPTEVRGVRIVPPQDGEPAPVEMRRTRTKKPSNVAPVPMPPASDDDGDAPHEIPPSSGGR